jgi:hypothetical protein
METGTRKKETSPWAYIGCGCAALVVLAMAGIAGISWVAYREGKKFEKTQSDPAAREAKAREVLPWDELPAGYYPMGSFSIPFVMDFTMFSDQPPTPGPRSDRGNEFKERGFVFIRMRRFGRGSGDLRDFIQGKREEPSWLKESNTDYEAGELIRRGAVEVNGQELLYRASRGSIRAKGEHKEGITTLLVIDCPRDRRVRFGIWFGPDPHPTEPLDHADYTGTNADPEEIRKFAAHFRFCGEGQAEAR